MSEDQLPDTIKLFDPEHVSLTYGASNEIQFGPKGGFDEHIWIGLRAHPMLPALLSSYPGIREADVPLVNLFVCEDCDASFGTKVGLRNHKKVHAAK